MGLTKSDCKLLFYCKKEGVSFNQVLTLGRLTRYFSKQEIIELAHTFLNESISPSLSLSQEFSDDLFKILGAQNYVTTDYSDYEGASFVHDMNQPLPQDHLARYTCVLDSGTIEHVFNFPQAIKNCMTALEVGGHYIGITPANNLMGHGFYQFSPELYYRVFSSGNGFRVKKMFIAPLNSDVNWYEVSDPANVGSRVSISNKYPLTLMIVAEKIEQKEVFRQSPMQSDYTAAWNKHLEKKTDTSIKEMTKKVLPNPIKGILIKLKNFFQKKKIEDEFLGVIESAHFKKTDI